MKNKKFRKIISAMLAGSLLLSTSSIASNSIVEAKGSRPSVSRSAKPSSSKPSSTKPSSKPNSSNKSAKPTTSNSSSSTKSSSSSKNFTRSSKGSYNKNYNSYNNQEYKKQYTDYLNNNYRSSGFFSGSSILNGLMWYTLFNSVSSSTHRAQATDQQKELVDNIKDSKVPVYMLEIKTKDGETKYVSVTKEQYEKVKEGDNISIKNGNLEIKTP